MKGKKGNLKKDVIKKTNGLTIFLVALFFVVGVLGGVGGYYFLSKNDEFLLVGEKEITIALNSEYVEQGVKVISFGKDKSKEVSITGEVDVTKPGKYTITYTSNDIKFKNVKRVRTITVLSGEQHE